MLLISDLTMWVCFLRILLRLFCLSFSSLIALSYSSASSEVITLITGPIIDPIKPNKGAFRFCILGGGFSTSGVSCFICANIFLNSLYFCSLPLWIGLNMLNILVLCLYSSICF